MQRLIERHPLQRGSHPSRDDGMCAMEMVAWLAGEEHSDEPRCACPVLAALVRACNDAMSDDARNRYLRPLVPQLVHTRSNASIERARGMLALDALVRVLVPMWLDRRGRADAAGLLRELPELQRLEHVAVARRVVATFAPEQRAAEWVLERALDGAEPARYVAGVVQVARALADGQSWTRMAELCVRMAAATGRPAGTGSEPRPHGFAAPGSADTSAPRSIPAQS